jgi:hypothetical protein
MVYLGGPRKRRGIMTKGIASLAIFGLTIANFA